MFLNGEIARLKEALTTSSSIEEINNDKDMARKTIEIVEKLDTYSNSQISDEILLSILKTQELVKEIYTDGPNG